MKEVQAIPEYVLPHFHSGMTEEEYDARMIQLNNIWCKVYRCLNYRYILTSYSDENDIKGSGFVICSGYMNNVLNWTVDSGGQLCFVPRMSDAASEQQYKACRKICPTYQTVMLPSVMHQHCKLKLTVDLYGKVVYEEDVGYPSAIAYGIAGVNDSTRGTITTMSISYDWRPCKRKSVDEPMLFEITKVEFYVSRLMDPLYDKKMSLLQQLHARRSLAKMFAQLF